MPSLFVISAPSGAGKTSLVKAALESDAMLTLSVSHTTRKQRKGEIDGTDYHFVSVDEFNATQKSGAFLEYAEVFGNFYGTSRTSIDRLLNSGKDVILEIDWQGAQQVQKIIPKCIAITILPPSRQALEDRLKKREQDSDATIIKRMQAATNEMSHYKTSDYLIINDQFGIALQDLLTIIRSQRLTCQEQTQRNKDLISDLLG